MTLSRLLTYLLCPRQPIVVHSDYFDDHTHTRYGNLHYFRSKYQLDLFQYLFYHVHQVHKSLKHFFTVIH